MRKPGLTILLFMSVALAGSTLASCGDDDNPTSPPPGGGGPTWNSGTLEADPDGAGALIGGSFQRTFTEEGTWDYRCTMHTGMTATIVVGPSTSLPESVTVSAGTQATPLVFEPASISLRTGGYIRWVNASGIPHNSVRP